MMHFTRTLVSELGLGPISWMNFECVRVLVFMMQWTRCRCRRRRRRRNSLSLELGILDKKEIANL